MKTTRKRKRLLKRSLKKEMSHFPNYHNYYSIFKKYKLFGMNPISGLDPNDRTWTFEVINKTDKKQSVILFGSINNFVNKNIEIEVPESSHETVKKELFFTTQYIRGLRMSVKTGFQLNNPLILTEEMSTGGLISRAFQPFVNNRSANPAQIDIPAFTFVARGNSYIEFEINPQEKVTFTFTITIKIMFNDIFVAMDERIPSLNWVKKLFKK